MSDSSDDPERAAERLEAALERIARRTAEQPATGQPQAGPGSRVLVSGSQVSGGPASGGGSVEAAQVVASLDTLIENLRVALGRTPGDRPD